MFDSLSDKLQDIIAKTAGQKELTQDNMQEALREIRRALLEADVNLRVVKAFISNIKDKAEGENVLQGVNPSQQLVKIVHDELIELLGKEVSPLDFSGPAAQKAPSSLSTARFLCSLQQTVAVGTAEEVAATRKSVSVLLAERNQMCRLNK